MSTFFINLYNYFHSHRSLLWALLLMMVLLCSYGALNLQTDENVSAFLPQNTDNERVNYAFGHIEADNQIVLSLRCVDTLDQYNTDLLQEAVDVLAEHLQYIDTSLMRGVRYVVDQQQMQQIAAFVLSNMPYLLTEADYIRIDTLLSPVAIAQRMAANRQLLSSPAGGLLKHTVLADPLGVGSALLHGLQSFSLGSQYQLIDDYIFNAQGNEATVLVQSAFPSSETGQNARLLELIRAAIDSTEQLMQHQVSVSLFGASDIAITNAKRIKRDSVITISVALVLIVAVLVYFYRSAKSIGLLVVALLFGGLFALGLLGYSGSRVSLLVIGVGSVIIGIAANYPLHFLAHIRQGYTSGQSLSDVAAPLLTGNITTIGAFLSLLFISSGAMHDLGLFASLLLAGTIVFVLVFLPHFYSRNTAGLGSSDNVPFARAANFRPENSRWFVLLVGLLTVVFWCYSGRTSFDTDMHHINYMTAEQQRQVAHFAKILDNNQQVLYCAAEGQSLDEALNAMEQSQPCIDTVAVRHGVSRRAGLANYLPSKAEQERRLALWADFWADRAEEVTVQITAAANKLGFRAGTFDGFTRLISTPHSVVEHTHFAPIIEAFGGAYVIETEGRAMVLSMLYVNPDRAQQLEADINALSPNIFAFSTGSITQKLINALSDDFDYVLYICGIIVFLFLTISFGRLELGLMAFMPLALGWVWILGIMGLTGIQFNIVNIILATFIFGQGDDYSIFVAEGLMYEYAYGKKMLKTYKSTVLLSAIIMFVGIGSLIFAKHPAMRSLGQVTVVGMGCVVLMAYVVPPLIFRWLTTSGGAKRPKPLTLTDMGRTVLAFTAFLLGSIALTIAGFVLITIGRPTERHKFIYHRMLCAVMRFCARAIMNVEYHVDNQFPQAFDTPSIIISNHQSHLDLMYTLMLSPKIICLTNKWVWNCPFYGWIIRYADFLPVVNGIEANTDKLRALVSKGYSIFVFPEGTRSADCSIQRFHQGAFYLARELGLDIQPVLLHGVGHVFPKNEFVLRPGRVDVRVMPRIEAANVPADTKAAARELRRLYECEYANMATQLETTSYFYRAVRDSYLYKGRSVARSARQTLSNNNGFATQVAALPENGIIRINNCGQGEFAIMAALVRKQQQVVASDPNPMLLDLARNNALVPSNLVFEDMPEIPVEQQVSDC